MTSSSSRTGTIWFTDPRYGIDTDYEGGKQDRGACPPASTGSIRDTGVAERSSPTISTGRTGSASRPTSACSTLPRAGLQFAEQPRRLIRAFDVTDRRSPGLEERASRSTRSTPVLPMGFAATTLATFGAAPRTASTASTPSGRPARQDQGALSPSRTSVLRRPQPVAAFSSARRIRLYRDLYVNRRGVTLSVSAPRLNTVEALAIVSLTSADLDAAETFLCPRFGTS